MVTRQTLATPPLFPYFRFESLHTLRCRFDLLFAVQSEPQKLALPSPPYPALGGVHLQPQVVNGFSDLMVDVFGPTNGKSARSSVGMSSLPNGIPVEIETIFLLKKER